jgi:DNA-binding NarL/FixJ family response regulator
MVSSSNLGRSASRDIAACTSLLLWLATMRPLLARATITTMRTTVLIVDDHEDFRRSAALLLAAEGFDVVGDVADGSAALDAVVRLRPDVVLLDVQLPELDGFAVAKQLAATPEPPDVVLVSSRDAAAYGRRLESASVRGFIAKRDLSGAALSALVA